MNNTETLITIAEAAKLRFRQRAEELRYNGSNPDILRVVEFNDGEAEKIERAIAEARERCKWEKRGGTYYTCAWSMQSEECCASREGEMLFKFCPFCGKPIE